MPGPFWLRNLLHFLNVLLNCNARRGTHSSRSVLSSAQHSGAIVWDTAWQRCRTSTLPSSWRINAPSSSPTVDALCSPFHSVSPTSRAPLQALPPPRAYSSLTGITEMGSDGFTDTSLSHLPSTSHSVTRWLFLIPQISSCHTLIQKQPQLPMAFRISLNFMVEHSNFQ